MHMSEFRNFTINYIVILKYFTMQTLILSPNCNIIKLLFNCLLAECRLYIPINYV